MLREIVDKRYSCRKYVDKKVDTELLYKCIETAGLAPSACNSQPWKFYLVTDDLKRKELVKLTQPFTENAYFIVVEEKKPSFPEKLVNQLKNQDFPKIDIGISVAYLTLQAAELGLASCIIGYFNEEKIKNTLNIDAKSRLRLVISVGFEDENEKHRLIRKDIDEIIKKI